MILFFVFFISCTGTLSLGGSEAGNPPTSSNRSVLGNVTATSNSSTSFLTANAAGCEADLVIAFDSTGGMTEAEAGSDCSFDLNLATGKAYEIEFYLNNEFVAYLVMMNDDSILETQVMIVSPDDDSINLGHITIIDFQAFPENQPATQNDIDDDGIFDFDDEDDDGDGRFDNEEEDCDLDGFLDDFDDFFSDGFNCADGDDFAPEVIDVVPWNDEEFVPLDQEVLVLFSCDIDFTTVNSSTFQIKDPLNNTTSCTYDIDGNDLIICNHDGDPFDNDTEYTATINGVKCLDGQTIPTIAWSWNTGADL